MRHQRVTKKFSRGSKQRKNLWRGLLTSLIISGQIKTTLAKGKYLKKNFDKLVFIARKNPDLAPRKIYREIPNRIIVAKFLKEILPTLPSGTGLTTFVRLGRRTGDNTEMVLISIRKVEPEINPDSKDTREKKSKIQKITTEKVI